MDSKPWRRVIPYLSATVGLLAAATTLQAAEEPLRAYNVDIRQTSVSGVSSGGHMAVQLDVAFSSILKGAGIVAGGPYYCAQGSVSTALGPCMAASAPVDIPKLVRLTNDSAAAGVIDPISHLANHKVWLFSGGADTIVKQSVMNDLEAYYKNYISSANIFHKKRASAEHAMPTENYGNQCSVRDDPYINDCDYDAAGHLLEWIYNGLNPKATEPLTGTFLEFDQGEFISNPNAHSMASTGWLYVPANCASGAPCKLHVAFHGCLQYPSYAYRKGGIQVVYGTTFVKNAGYNEWADSNSMIVLYPQAQRTSRWFWDIWDFFNANPQGCWDWWGYDDPNYAKKGGRQMAAVKKMIDRIAGSHLR